MKRQTQAKNHTWQMLIYTLVIFAVVGALLIIQTPTYAQSESPGTPTDDEVNAIAKQLYCPVCENIPLDVCPTQACAEWRELIRLKLGEGWGDAQIKEYFVEQYGARVLASPPASGFNWLVYIIPVVGITAGIFLLYKAFRSLRSPETIDEPIDEIHSEEDEDDYIARLEEELRQR